MNADFFKDLKGGISNIMGILLYRQNVTALATYLKISPSLVYAWVNPGQPQIPNMEQFFKSLEFVSQNNPGAVRQALQMVNQPCGYQAISFSWVSKVSVLKAIVSELEGGPGEAELLQFPPAAGRRPLLKAMMEEATQK